MSVKQAVRNRENWKQFINFGVVGGSGVLVNMLVAVIMTKLHGGLSHANDPLFNLGGTGLAFRFTALVFLVGTCVANVTNFQLNRSWTFRHVHHRPWLREFLPFFGIGLTAALVGMLFKMALTNPTSPIYLPTPPFSEDKGLTGRDYWAQMIAILFVTPINFIFNKLFTFVAVKGHHHGEEEDLDIPLVAPVVAPELVDDTGEIRKLSDEEIARRDRERGIFLGEGAPAQRAATAGQRSEGATRADETGRRLEG